MPKGQRVSRALAESVKDAKKKYPMMTNYDIGRFCGTSDGTVSKIVNGAYDDLLGEPAGTVDVKGQVDVGELERLVAEADDYLRIIAFALIVLIDPDVKETHDMCARWRKKIDVYGYHGQVDKED